MKYYADRIYPGLDVSENLGVDANGVVESEGLPTYPSSITSVTSDQTTQNTLGGLGKSTTWHRIDFPTPTGGFEVTPVSMGWNMLFANVIFNSKELSGSGITVKLRATNGAEKTRPVFKWVNFNSNNPGEQNGTISIIVPIYLVSLNPVYLEVAAGTYASGDPHTFFGDSNTLQMLTAGVEFYHHSSITLLSIDGLVDTPTLGVHKIEQP